MKASHFYHTPRLAAKILMACEYLVKKIIELFPLVFVAYSSTAIAFQIDGMRSPDSFIVDPKTGIYYVSNVNGGSFERNGLGFISKIGPDGRLVNLRFIQSGKSGVTLNAPKGLIIIDGSLYTVDIDRVLRFNLKTGRLTSMIDMTPLGVVHLDYLAEGPGKTIFVSDMLGEAIYKIEPLNRWHIVSYANVAKLGQLKVLLYDARFKRLIFTRWGKPKLLGLQADGSIIDLFKNPLLKFLGGMTFDGRGSIIFSSFYDGKVFRVKNYSTLEVLRKNIITPANVSVDVKKNLVLVPSYKGNLVFTIPIH